MAKKALQPEHLTEILDYQERLAKAVEKVKSIENLIEEQQGIIVQTRSAIPAMAENVT